MRWRVVWHDSGFEVRDFGSKQAAEDCVTENAKRGEIATIIPPTLAQLAREAIEVQNACNLSGVVRTYAEVLTALRDLPECTGNTWLHAHPIAVAFADKIASLTGIQDFGNDGAMAAHGECDRLAKGES